MDDSYLACFTLSLFFLPCAFVIADLMKQQSTAMEKLWTSLAASLCVAVAFVFLFLGLYKSGFHISMWLLPIISWFVIGAINVIPHLAAEDTINTVSPEIILPILYVCAIGPVGIITTVHLWRARLFGTGWLV